MNIKQYIDSLPAARTGLLKAPLKELFSGVSDLDLEFLEAMLGIFGAACYLTTVKEYRKKLSLKGFAPVDVHVIKEISELEYDKFLVLYGEELKSCLTDSKTGFHKRFSEWKENEIQGLDQLLLSVRNGSFARAKPTSAGWSANDDRQPGNYQYWVQDEHGNWSRGKTGCDGDEVSGETRKMDPNQLASFRNIIDRIVSDIQILYQQFLDNPRKPVAIQKKLNNFAGKQDSVKLIVTIAKPMGFALVNKETDTLEVTTDVPELNTSRIKLGALKLLCLETIASLGRKLELEERPDAVVDGFYLSSIRLRDRFTDSYQIASLQWYIPVSKEVAIYFQVEIKVPSPAPSPFFDNSIFRQAPKYKEL